MPGYVYIHETGCPMRIVAVASVVTIGRTTDNTIILADDLVSRSHALLQSQGNAVVLLDLDSTNGTLVNDQLVDADEPVVLHDGDVITIGNASLRYALAAGEGS